MSENNLDIFKKMYLHKIVDMADRKVPLNDMRNFCYGYVELAINLHIIGNTAGNWLLNIVDNDDNSYDDIIKMTKEELKNIN